MPASPPRVRRTQLRLLAACGRLPWGLLCTLLCALLSAPPGVAATPPQTWVTAWQAASQSIPAGSEVPAWRKAPLLHDQTLREVLVPELSGSRLRLRLDNRWSDRPLRIESASVAASARGAEVREGSSAPLRFQGATQVVVPPHASVWSDALAWPVRAGEALSVSLYLPDATLPRSWHRWGAQVQYLSGAGDHALDTGAAAFRSRLTSYLWLDRLDVQPLRPSAALVAIGDSITDGMRSTINARRSWPQQLGAELRAAGVDDLAVINAGISGNRLLADSACWGDALRERFAHDALRAAGVRAVVVLIGINDIDFADTPRLRGLDCDAPHLRPTLEQLSQALAQLAQQAHAAGVRIYAATLTPAALPPTRESLRLQLNAWLRSSRDFDGLLDFDAALRDPADPRRMLPRFDSGDRVHPSDAGYAAMARVALPLALREAANPPAQAPQR